MSLNPYLHNLITEIVGNIKRWPDADGYNAWQLSADGSLRLSARRIPASHADNTVLHFTLWAEGVWELSNLYIDDTDLDDAELYLTDWMGRILHSKGELRATMARFDSILENMITEQQNEG